jgi:holo-[acyl-carrier protein] synthase
MQAWANYIRRPGFVQDGTSFLPENGMILGLGTDIVEVGRIRAMLERHAEAFLERVYTETERRDGAGRDDPAMFFASRWAAKEALSKALGCGIGRDCAWQDIAVRNDASGRPWLELGGAAAATAARLGASATHLSISHEKHYTCATVVLEGAPPRQTARRTKEKRP